MTLFSRYFQIRDDYQNLVSPDVRKADSQTLTSLKTPPEYTDTQSTPLVRNPKRLLRRPGRRQILTAAYPQPPTITITGPRRKRPPSQSPPTAPRHRQDDFRSQKVDPRRIREDGEPCVHAKCLARSLLADAERDRGH
jgi:hypothetical protein